MPPTRRAETRVRRADFVSRQGLQFWKFADLQGISRGCVLAAVSQRGSRMKRIIGMAAAAALVLLQVGTFAALNAEVPLDLSPIDVAEQRA